MVNASDGDNAHDHAHEADDGDDDDGDEMRRRCKHLEEAKLGRGVTNASQEFGRRASRSGIDTFIIIFNSRRRSWSIASLAVALWLLCCNEKAEPIIQFVRTHQELMHRFSAPNRRHDAIISSFIVCRISCLATQDKRAEGKN